MMPALAPEILYRHPDCWTIGYAENALIATDDDLNFVIVPIGRDMLLELSTKLYDIGRKPSANHWLTVVGDTCRSRG